jgi:DnaA-homolog protein
MRQLPLGVRIPDRAVFASFLAGPNRQACEHAARLAAGERGVLWLCGPPGSGKSHLLQAICGAPGSAGTAAYLPLAQLAAFGPEILEGLPGLDCVCIDDVDGIAGLPVWERALFALYRSLEERGAGLALAAAAPPALLRWTLADLGSRLGAAAVYQLRPLDEDEQRAALQLRARVRGFELPDETARWLQRRLPRDMRTLYELLDALDEEALVAQRRLTVPFIREVLARRVGG